MRPLISPTTKACSLLIYNIYVVFHVGLVEDTVFFCRCPFKKRISQLHSLFFEFFVSRILLIILIGVLLLFFRCLVLPTVIALCCVIMDSLEKLFCKFWRLLLRRSFFRRLFLFRFLGYFDCFAFFFFGS